MAQDIQVSYEIGEKFAFATQEQLDAFRAANPEKWSSLTPAAREGREPIPETNRTANVKTFGAPSTPILGQ